MSLLIFGLLLFLASFCAADCSVEGSSRGQPPRKLKKPIAPFIVEENKACPYYGGRYGCCNSVQIAQLVGNFQTLDSIFGTDCPICALNMKIFWCEFTCNPKQSEFLRPLNYIKVMQRGKLLDALNVTFALSPDSVCELFRSCNKVPETMMMASNGQGFIQFQGDQAVDRGGVKMNLLFTDKEKDGLKPLVFDVHPCNSSFPNNTVKGYTNLTKCACSYCAKSCGFRSQAYVAPPYFEGFNWLLVLVVYLVISAIVVVMYFVFRRKRQQTNAETIEDDKYLLNPTD